MEMIAKRLNGLDWSGIRQELHRKGFVTVKNVLKDDECNELIQNYSTASRYRKTIIMERYRFGLGEYKYFSYSGERYSMGIIFHDALS